MKEFFNRYRKFSVNGETRIPPFINLPRKASDKVHVYRQGESRLDSISQQYYGNPWHGWLILLANPEFGGLEWRIPDNEALIIPYPFKDSIQQYNEQVGIYQQLYENS